MLPWMLGGVAIVAFFAWRVIYNAEQHDKAQKLIKKKSPKEY